MGNAKPEVLFDAILNMTHCSWVTVSCLRDIPTAYNEAIYPDGLYRQLREIDRTSPRAFHETVDRILHKGVCFMICTEAIRDSNELCATSLSLSPGVVISDTLDDVLNTFTRVFPGALKIDTPQSSSSYRYFEELVRELPKSSFTLSLTIREASDPLEFDKMVDDEREPLRSQLLESGVWAWLGGTGSEFQKIATDHRGYSSSAESILKDYLDAARALKGAQPN